MGASFLSFRTQSRLDRVAHAALPDHKRPRLTFYSYDSNDNPWLGGGGAVRDWEILRRFADKADVTLVVGGYPGLASVTRDGIRIEAAGSGATQVVSRIAYVIVANLRLLFDSADLVGLSPSIHSPLVTWLTRRRPTYLVVHHYIGTQTLRKLGARGIFPFLSEQVFMRAGRSYCVVNRAVGDRIRRMSPAANVHISSNGVHPDLLNLPTAASTRSFVLFVGRFDVYMKGLDVLIRSFADVSEARDVDLMLAGRATPRDVETVKRLIPDSIRRHVHVEANISEARKRELLSACLCFCAPSRFEGFGIAALEASAAGKAVLVTDTEGTRDSQVANHTALIVAPGDGPNLTAALERLIDDEPLRVRLGRAGRAHAAQFTWDAIAKSDWQWIRALLRD